MEEICQGSMGEPGERPGVETFLPTARCAMCGHFVEIHAVEPSESRAAWRLELHDTSGRTVRLVEEGNPAADTVVPLECPRCGSRDRAIQNEEAGLVATCWDCGHRWRAGHLNPG